jgi:ferrous iron transport protein A
MAGAIDMAQNLPLIMMPEGREAKIARINAGRGLTHRLIEMGFTENTVIKVLRADRGCLIVLVNGSRYALSRGIAMKIMVSETNN